MQAVAAHMGPHYTAQMVLHHHRFLQPARVTGKWQPAEDELLKQVSPPGSAFCKLSSNEQDPGPCADYHAIELLHYVQITQRRL